jgi:hypothetical protein
MRTEQSEVNALTIKISPKQMAVARRDFKTLTV